MDKKAELASANQTQQADLTECQPKAQLLRSELDLCTAILNTVSALVVVFDPEGHIVHCNRAFEQTTSYAFDEVRNQPFWELFLIQDEKESVKAIFEKIQQDKMAIAHSHDWITKDGICRRIAWDYTPFLDSDSTAKYVIGTGIDITQRQQAESELHRLHEELDSRVRERMAQLEKVNLAIETDFWPGTVEWHRSLGYLGSVCTALMLGDEPVGMLGLAFQERKEFTASEFEFFQALAQQATLAIQLTQLAEEAKLAAIAREQEKAALERAAELAKANEALQAEVMERKRASELARGQTEALSRTLNLLATEPELDKFLGYMLTTITELLSPQKLALSSTLWFHDPATNLLTLHTMYYRGEILTGGLMPDGANGVPTTCNVAESVSWSNLVCSRCPFVMDMGTVSHYPGFKGWHPWLSAQGVKALIVVPLLRGCDVIGVLNLYNSERSYYSPEEIELAQVLAGQVSLAVQLTHLAEQSRQTAVLEVQEKAAQKQAAELSEINKVLQAEVADRKRAEQVSRGQTEALVKTLTVLAAEPVLDNFLGYVLQAIAQQLGEPCGGIWLYDEAYDTTILHIDYEDGQIRRGAEISRPGASRQNVLKQWDADYMQLLQEKKVLIQNVQDLPQTPAYAQSRAYNQKRGIKTILVVCLFFGEKFLGNITLRSTKRRDYKPEELELACVLAYQASLAIQLTRLAEQTQQSAVLKERNRIAREIHDTLAQVLTGIVVQLQAAEDVHTTDPSDRQAHIATARQLAKQGLTEARRSVRALRPQALEGNDLTGALANLIKQMGAGTGLQTVCRVQGTPYFLSPDVESNLLRIAQEAFTNILKHAEASEIQIELVYHPGQVRLRVLDNGQGFDPNLTPTESYGLIGMRERTQSIGAELTITSQPGEGTEVLVVVPILSPAQRSLL